MKKILKSSLLLLMLLFLVSCGGEKDQPMEMVKVVKGSIRAQIPSVGVVEPRNRLEIKPPISGRIDQVLVLEGQRVAKGEILAWMSSSDRAALLDAARAKGEEEVRHWEEVYKPAPIVAPLDGFIIQRNAEPGQSVAVADAVLVMADRLIVKAQVDETDIGSIRVGQSVDLELDSYPGQKISGKVEQVAYESKLISNVNIYEVNILPDSVPSFFRSGMSATVNFILQDKKEARLLPLSAVKKIGNRAYVFIEQRGKKEPVPLQIKTGLENTLHIEVVSDLKEGDPVVVPTVKMLEKIQKSGRPRGPMNPFEKKKE